MELHLVLGPSATRTDGIYRGIRDAILSRRLSAGDRLPPSRELARDLGVARSTVLTAYDRLTGDGIIEARQGAGTFVAETLQVAGVADAPGTPASLQPRRAWTGMDAPRRPSNRPRFDFRAGIPDARLFPLETWRRLVSHELRRDRLDPHYGDPSGHPSLRAAVAHHVAVSRGIEATAADVLVTNGTQQAVDIAGKVLVDRGDRVAVEDPGYPPIARALQAMGARIDPIPVDDEGLRVDRLHPSTRLVCVSPSHQFPMGTTMSLGRRMALLTWADRHDAAILEDDYDSEFRFGSGPVDPLRALDHHGRVLYVGTFSKTLIPQLRLGFMVLPPSLQRAGRAAKYLSDGHTATPAQAALARFIDDGGFSRHLRRVRRIYGERRAIVRAGVPEHLGEWLELVPSTVGLHVAARSRLHTDRVAAAVALARARGVGVDAIEQFCRSGPPTSGIVLAFTNIDADAAPEGLLALRGAFSAVVRR